MDILDTAKDTDLLTYDETAYIAHLAGIDW